MVDNKFDLESQDDLDDDDEDYDSDDSEIRRELEERIRNAQDGGKDKIFDDVSDTKSVMSMTNTMTNMNFIPIDTDLDNLIDQMLQNQDPKRLAELERQRNEQLDQLRREQEENEKMIFTEENKRNIEDMK